MCMCLIMCMCMICNMWNFPGTVVFGISFVRKKNLLLTNDYLLAGKGEGSSLNETKRTKPDLK